MWHSYLHGQGYRNSADGKFVTAKLLVPECLDMCDLITIRCFFQKTWRYMDAYRYACSNPVYAAQTTFDNTPSRKKLDAHQATFANKQYKSHRRVGLPSDIIESMAAQDKSKTS